VKPKKIQSGPGKQWMEGKDFRLAKEIKYIQRQAAKHDGRFVTIGPLVFFSTETGDAWMLDPSCQLAARLARNGDPEPIDFEETEVTTALRAGHSSTSTESPGGSSRSSAILPPKLRD
jgi:hypothetical protein